MPENEQKQEGTTGKKWGFPPAAVSSKKQEGEQAVEGELVAPTAAEQLALVRSKAAELAEQKSNDVLSAISTYDWKAVKPPELAAILSKVPFKAKVGEPDYYLKPWQAMVFAMRCYELGLSPFSNEVWFNPQNNKVNVSFEGKQKLARDRGYNFGPPQFIREMRDKNLPAGMPDLAGDPKKEVGVKCRMSVSGPAGKEFAEYTAWLSEWYVPSSPVWKSKPEHMLQLRAAEKCLSFASGTGSSEMPGEADIDGSAGPTTTTAAVPEVEVTEFAFKEPVK